MLYRSLLCFLGLLLVLGACADSLFYWPDDHVYAPPQAFHPNVEEVWFNAPSGPRLHAWWLPSLRPAERTIGTVVYCHGNNANISLHARFVNWLPERGFNVLVFDYRGYGRSEGSVSREGTVEDAVAAIDFAEARDPGRVVVFGHSLGGAIGIVATARRPAVRGIVAESTFPTYREIAARKVGLLGFLAWVIISSGCDPQSSLDALPPRPLFVIHGTEDRIVPVWFGQALYDRAPEPKELLLIEGGGHATPWLALGEQFEQLLVEFFERCVRD